MTFKVYIPARFGATRLPGKPLLDVGGKPLIRHVYERACRSGASEVVIATDDERIAEAAARFGAQWCMTSATHASGSDRIAEAVRLRGEAGDQIIVNVQGDEPRMPPLVIDQVAELARQDGCDIATVCEPLDEKQLWDPNVVKVVRDSASRALYFSRAAIPWSRDEFAGGAQHTAELKLYRRHIGLYAYRVDFLLRFVATPVAELERIEALEQLRALAGGARIIVADALTFCGTGIDTAADLVDLRQQPEYR